MQKVSSKRIMGHSKFCLWWLNFSGQLEWVQHLRARVWMPSLGYGLNPSRHRSVVRPQIDIRHVGLSKNRRVNQRETTLFSGSLF